jgi:exodeoxyribonuclease VII small subunit
MADRDQPPARPPSDRRRETPSEPRVDRGRDAAEAGGAEPSFEAALDRLEGIVGRLEGGDLALEDALSEFEEGVRLSRRLADRLAAAERRIEELVREGGGLAERPFDGREDDA